MWVSVRCAPFADNVLGAAWGQVASGLSEGFVSAVLDRYARCRPTGDVQEILGRPARSFAEWVADTAAAFQVA